jgi:hypothetical protein
LREQCGIQFAEYDIFEYTNPENEVLSLGNDMATVTTPTTPLPSAQDWNEVLADILPPQGGWSEEEYLVLTDHRNRLIEFTDGFLEEAGIYKRGESASSVLLAGFSVAVAAVFDTD